jgi:hypothetical protein
VEFACCRGCQLCWGSHLAVSFLVMGEWVFWAWQLLTRVHQHHHLSLLFKTAVRIQNPLLSNERFKPRNDASFFTT